MDITSLRDEIRLFLEKTGMGPTYFGKCAAGNSELVSRLEDGRTITMQTAERVKSFIANYRATTKTNGGAAGR